MERLAPFLAGISLAFIFLTGIVKGLSKPLWFDELYTTFITRIPGAAEIWDFACTGADGQPPLYYYTVKASVHLIGNEPLGVRLPSILGYVLFCLCLYVFVSRIASKTYGLIALLLPAVTGCWYYLTEARPYGLVLGCTGLAAVCWQSIALNPRRKLALAGLGLSLSAAFAFHFFALLLAAPFAAAEAVRTIRRRKLDPAVWIAIAMPCIVLAVNFPVVLKAGASGGRRAYAFARPAWIDSLREFGEQFLTPAIIPLTLVACLYIAYRASSKPDAAQREHEADLKMNGFAPEIALLLGLVCLPSLCVAVAKFGGQSFYPRYAIGAMFGLASIIVLIIWRAFWGRKSAGVIVALLFLGLLARLAAFDLIQAQRVRRIPIRESVQSRIPKLVWDHQLPIAVGDSFAFMQLSYYGSPALVSRMCYLASPEYDVSYNGANNAELGLIKSAPYFGTRVVDYRAWTKAHRDFYLLGGMAFAIEQLVRDGAHLQLLKAGRLEPLFIPADPRAGEADLFFRVSMPAR